MQENYNFSSAMGFNHSLGQPFPGLNTLNTSSTPSIQENLSNISFQIMGITPGPGDYFTLINGKLVLVHVYTVDELMPYILTITLSITLIFGYIGFRYIGPWIADKLKKSKKEGIA